VLQHRLIDRMTLADMERAALVAAIKSQGSIAGAARHLGIGRATAFRMVKRYGLRDEDLGYAPEVPVAEESAAAPVPERPASAAATPATPVAPAVDPLFKDWKP